MILYLFHVIFQRKYVQNEKLKIWREKIPSLLNIIPPAFNNSFSPIKVKTKQFSFAFLHSTLKEKRNSHTHSSADVDIILENLAIYIITLLNDFK